MRRLVLLLAVAAAGCATEEPREPGPSQAGAADRVVRDFVLTESLAGRVEWRLEATEARHYTQEAVTRLDDLTVRFFNVDGTLNSTLTSLRGQVDDATGNMIATGDVRVLTAEGDTLTTDELEYSRTRDLIHGEDYVRLAKPDRVVTGVGFEAKPDLSSYQVKSQVDVRILDGGGALDER